MFSRFINNPSSRRAATRMLAMVALYALPFVVMAANGGALPFEGPLATLQDSLTGPVAMAISVIGVVAAGAMLIFGGDMNGFMRSIVFLVLVIGLIVGASSLITTLFVDADTGGSLSFVQVVAGQGIC